MTSPSDELVALVPVVQLRDITFRELSAKRAGESGTSDGIPDFKLNVMQNNDDPTLFRIRLRCSVSFGDGSQLVAEPEAEYQVTDGTIPVPLPQRLAVEYVNEVAVMALLPYARHAFADLSLRVFRSLLLMPIFARGTIAFPLDGLSNVVAAQSPGQ